MTSWLSPGNLKCAHPVRSAIIPALCVRVLQGFAEMLHERVRKELWGYSTDEILNASDLHKIKYSVSFAAKNRKIKSKV